MGGGFATAHRTVSGPVPSEARRQRDVADQITLAQWRDGARLTTPETWAEQGRAHNHHSAEGRRPTASAAPMRTTQ